MASAVVDENGKPEVSVALTDFTAFVGFRPPSHIVAFMAAVPEFADLFSEGERDQIRNAQNADKTTAKAALKTLFGTLIGYSEDKAKAFILGITEKLRARGPKAAFGDNEDAESLSGVWKRNLEVFGDKDVGVIITAYLMNLVQLKAGEGCWILADDIHAYVEAQGIIECMANSDNMVCHGLGETVCNTSIDVERAHPSCAGTRRSQNLCRYALISASSCQGSATRIRGCMVWRLARQDTAVQRAHHRI